ncbi:MAG: hypothetical protein V7606_5076 [Burkholderiales bacterium]
MQLTNSDPVNFYRDLPVIPSFAEAATGRSHPYVPDDWWIVVADVAGSTQAIEAGAYKDVNTVGVACIAAVVNVDRGIDIPYVFGGDGAFFAIPGSLFERVLPALRAAQKLARENFGLALRVGLVRVEELNGRGHPVRMGKVRISPHVTQPVLSGGGWAEAERRVKSQHTGGVMHVDERDGPAEGSFDGFECRWQGIPSFNGHKLSLLVAAVDGMSGFQVYERVFEQIQAIYGDVAQYHPLRVDRMRMTFNPRLLSHESRVRATHLGMRGRLTYFFKLIGLNLVGSYLFSRNIDTESVRWSRYLDDMVENSDFRKFDGVLRMVIDGSDAQAEQLQRYLDAEFRKGRLVYGLHKSRKALVTCIVHSYNGDHQHFVDGSDGGYALAAREMKGRMADAMTRKARGETPG